MKLIKPERSQVFCFPWDSIRLCAWLAIVCLALGCSNQPATYLVEGKVQFSDGTPVQFGEIETFQAELKLNARGSIQKDGSFRLGTFAAQDGAVAGKHQVVITQFSAGPLSGNVKFDTVEHKHGHNMSKTYAAYESSPLEFEVVAGQSNQVTLVIDEFTPGASAPGH